MNMRVCGDPFGGFFPQELTQRDFFDEIVTAVSNSIRTNIAISLQKYKYQLPDFDLLRDRKKFDSNCGVFTGSDSIARSLTNSRPGVGHQHLVYTAKGARRRAPRLYADENTSLKMGSAKLYSADWSFWQTLQLNHWSIVHEFLPSHSPALKRLQSEWTAKTDGELFGHVTPAQTRTPVVLEDHYHVSEPEPEVDAAGASRGPLLLPSGPSSSAFASSSGGLDRASDEMVDIALEFDVDAHLEAAAAALLQEFAAAPADSKIREQASEGPKHREYVVAVLFVAVDKKVEQGSFGDKKNDRDNHGALPVLVPPYHMDELDGPFPFLRPDDFDPMSISYFVGSGGGFPPLMIMGGTGRSASTTESSSSSSADRSTRISLGKRFRDVFVRQRRRHVQRFSSSSAGARASLAAVASGARDTAGSSTEPYVSVSPATSATVTNTRTEDQDAVTTTEESASSQLQLLPEPVAGPEPAFWLPNGDPVYAIPESFWAEKEEEERQRLAILSRDIEALGEGLRGIASLVSEQGVHVDSIAASVEQTENNAREVARNAQKAYDSNWSTRMKECGELALGGVVVFGVGASVVGVITAGGKIVSAIVVTEQAVVGALSLFGVSAKAILGSMVTLLQPVVEEIAWGVLHGMQEVGDLVAEVAHDHLVNEVANQAAAAADPVQVKLSSALALPAAKPIGGPPRPFLSAKKSDGEQAGTTPAPELSEAPVVTVVLATTRAEQQALQEWVEKEEKGEQIEEPLELNKFSTQATLSTSVAMPTDAAGAESVG
eukprot:g9698.t1